MTGQHSLSFAKAISSWCDRVGLAAEEVFHEASIEAVTQMQMIGPSTAYPSGQGGRNPVDTGWHTANLEISLSEMPTIDPKSNPPSYLVGQGLHVYKWDREKTFAQIRAAALGSTIYAGYTSAYALHLEYRGGQSSLFVKLVAQRWGSIVDQSRADAKRKYRL